MSVSYVCSFREDLANTIIPKTVTASLSCSVEKNMSTNQQKHDMLIRLEAGRYISDCCDLTASFQ